MMESLKEKVVAWIRKDLSSDGQLDWAAYNNSLVMVRMEGTDFRLSGEWLPDGWHVFLQVHKGELRLTASGERLGFDSPVYVDFLKSREWKDVTLAGNYRACFIVMEQHFFMEATLPIRSKITEGMEQFAKHPFTPVNADEDRNLSRLEEMMFSTLSADSHLFCRELIQALACAWQYKLWNLFFHRQQTVRSDTDPHWNDVISQFFYLAHTYCREQHRVSWYAAQLGVSADALSAALKRLHGKTASAMLEELLAAEAKVCLRNPVLSVQDVAEMLHFSDQSAFGKFFKRHCGISPAVFKKRHIEENNS